ncbi:MAG: ATP-binding protein [Ardenticatenaceae bacterium]|nr:ATP-binding protein [Ardenticatenaceae bacterium]
MFRFSWQHLSLATKLNILMMFLIVATASAITFLSIRREQQAFQAELQAQAQLTLDLLEETIEDELYLLDVDDISDVLEKMGEQEGVFTSGRVYDPDGRVLADAFDEGVTFQETADPFALRLLESDSIVFEWQEDQLLTGQPVRVASLTLGAISIGLPTSELDEKVVATRNQGIFAAAFAVIVGGLAVIIFSRSISKPIQNLVTNTERIAQGDLSSPLNADRKDEIGRLAEAMERMRQQLFLLYQDLEGQVDARTNELILARDEALRASQFKSELLGKVSHELRTPIGAILGYTQLLQAGSYGPLLDDQIEVTEKVIESTNYLTTIVRELLDQARLDSGRVELHIEPFDIAELVEEIENQHRIFARNKGIDFEVETTFDLGTTMYGDRQRIQQCVINLLSNAIKFTDEGFVRLEVYHADPAWWAIRVTDTGPGIPEEARDRIFEPFGQVDGSITRRYGGTGLGLAIVKNFIELMGGEIKLESEVGGGSTFIIILPVTPEENPDGMVAEAAPIS